MSYKSALDSHFRLPMNVMMGHSSCEFCTLIWEYSGAIKRKCQCFEKNQSNMCDILTVLCKKNFFKKHFLKNKQQSINVSVL